ncbi:hypothetical protein [Anabaena sp. CCY 9402-a]|uniref:hypothetical protein n=1 Tax=Anabaena sp. CCY 9402-a TaxID=3103867 RepID=UPI0039C62EDF
MSQAYELFTGFLMTEVEAWAKEFNISIAEAYNIYTEGWKGLLDTIRIESVVTKKPAMQIIYKILDTYNDYEHIKKAMPYQSDQTRTIKSQVRSLSELLESAEDILAEIAKHPHYLRLLEDGYGADLNIADAQSAIAYLQDELIS